jgi:hypothetical protein
MRPFLLPLLALTSSALLALPARAQTTPPPAAPADTARTYKHHLGLTASPVLDGFFRNNRSLPVGVLYRRPLARPDRALRLRLVGRYARLDTTDFTVQLAGSGRRAWDVTAFAGYEAQRALNRRWAAYAGAEIGLGVGRSSWRELRERANDSGVGTYIVDYRYVGKHWQVQVRPFAGLRLQISPAITIFAEAAAPLSYRRHRDDYTGDVVRQNTLRNLVRSSSFYTSNRFNFDLRPVQLVGLSTRF